MPRPLAIAIVLVFAALVAGCIGGGDGSDGSPGAGTVVDRTRAVPADVQAFLERVEDDPSTLTLDLTYDLLNKNGGDEHVVRVTSSPLTVAIDGTTIDLSDEPALVPYGIFSGFLAANPAAAIEAASRRADAGDAVITERDGMDCIAIPVQGITTSTWCLTPDGIFGYVDTPTVRYELR